MPVCTPIPEGFAPRFERLALEATGVRLAGGWRARAAETFPRIMREFSVESWEQLQGLLEATDPAAGQPLVERLVGEVTVKETRLFRDIHQMHLLSRVIIPEAKDIATRRGTPIRIWSAGCATGEEAYSLSMLASEVTVSGMDTPFAVLGTDISSSAIARARRGVYREPRAHWGTNEFTPLLDRYTSISDVGMRVVSDELRHRTRFAVHNLIAGPPVLGQDVVLCRNVMVYLPHEARVTLVGRLWDALAPGGWLLTGEADLLHLVPSRFETWSHEDATLYRKPLSASSARGGVSHG